MLKLIIFFRPFARYLLIVWVLTIIIASSMPNIPTLKIHTARAVIRLDYLIHFCEYGVLTFLAYLSFAGKDFRINYRKYIQIALVLILFAVADEFHQKFIPGRAFNSKDILSDIGGILATLILIIFVFRLIGNKLKKSD